MSRTEQSLCKLSDEYEALLQEWEGENPPEPVGLVALLGRYADQIASLKGKSISLQQELQRVSELLNQKNKIIKDLDGEVARRVAVEADLRRLIDLLPRREVVKLLHGPNLEPGAKAQILQRALELNTLTEAADLLKETP